MSQYLNESIFQNSAWHTRSVLHECLLDKNRMLSGGEDKSPNITYFQKFKGNSN